MTGNIAPPSADELLDVMKAGASDVLDILMARPTTFWNLKKPPEGGSSASDVASDLNIRAVAFAYVVVAVGCNRISPTYAGWPSFKALTQDLMNLTESLWWTRHEGPPADLGKADPRRLHGSLPSMAAAGYMVAVIGALNAQQPHPYTALLRYVDQDTDTAPAQLEAKFTRAIRSILRALPT